MSNQEPTGAVPTPDKGTVADFLNALYDFKHTSTANPFAVTMRHWPSDLGTQLIEDGVPVTLYGMHVNISSELKPGEYKFSSIKTLNQEPTGAVPTHCCFSPGGSPCGIGCKCSCHTPSSDITRERLEEILCDYHICANMMWSDVKDEVYTIEEYQTALEKMRDREITAIESLLNESRREELQAIGKFIWEDENWVITEDGSYPDSDKIDKHIADRIHELEGGDNG